MSAPGGDFWNSLPSGGAPAPGPGNPVPAEQPRAGRRGPIIAGLAVLAAVALIAVLAVSGVADRVLAGRAVAAEAPATTSVAAPPPPPAITAEGLPALLSGPEQVGDIIVATGMKVRQVYDKPDDIDAGTTYNPLECASALYSGMPPALSDTGFQAAYQTSMEQTGLEAGLSADQGVFLYPTAADAQRALDGYLALWQRCAGTMTVSWGGPTLTVDVVAPARTDDGISTLDNSGREAAFAVNRAIAVKGPVLVDCQVIGTTPQSTAAELARQILARIPA